MYDLRNFLHTNKPPLFLQLIGSLTILIQKLVKSEAPKVPNPLDLATGKEKAASVIFEL